MGNTNGKHVRALDTESRVTGGKEVFLFYVLMQDSILVPNYNQVALVGKVNQTIRHTADFLRQERLYNMVKTCCRWDPQHEHHEKQQTINLQETETLSVDLYLKMMAMMRGE